MKRRSPSAFQTMPAGASLSGLLALLLRERR